MQRPRAATTILLAAIVPLLVTAPLRAEELVCSGDVTSVQGEGLVAKRYRFEVSGVTGADETAVLENCRKIILQRQNVAAKRNPGGNFRPTSDLDLDCLKGRQQLTIHRIIRTR